MRIPWLLLSVECAAGMGLGFAPRAFRVNDPVSLYLNKVESDETQLPYSYKELPFVCPAADSQAVHLSLGEVLTGNRVWKSNYKLHYGVDIPCAKLCSVQADRAALASADGLIRAGYVAHWSLDGLPGATVFHTKKNNQKYYAAGFPLGFVENDVSYIYNHVAIVVRTHRELNGDSTIVGFEIYPKSVNNEECPGTIHNYENFALPRATSKNIANKPVSIPFTYTVAWLEDKLMSYASRWDLFYLNSPSHQHAHWLSLFNSLVLFALVLLIVAITLVRALKRNVEDLQLPLLNADTHPSELDEWKSMERLAKAPPHRPLVYTTLVALGIQFLVTASAVIVAFVISNHFGVGKAGARVNVLNNHQGGILSFFIFCFIAAGSVLSFWGVIWHRLFTGRSLRHHYRASECARISLLSSGSLPGLCLVTALGTNFFVWAKRSSSALPFGTIIVLLLLYTFAVLPLGLLGGFIANSPALARALSARGYVPVDKEVVPPPVPGTTSPYDRRNHRRQYLSPFQNGLLFGVIPFGIVYVELLFIFNSVWLEKTSFYYMYGFLLATALILLLVIVELTVIAVYFSLAAMGNPHWAWLSFRVGLSVGWYIFAYSVYYFCYYLRMRDFVLVLYYFGYMLLVCFAIGIGGGAAGAMSGYVFVHKLYRSISKND